MLNFLKTRSKVRRSPRPTRKLPLEALEERALLTSWVTARHVFYNDSAFDGYDTAINANDNNAIAPDKSALLMGAGQATLANITSYDNGINGIMIDITGRSSHGPLTANDFVFSVGRNNSPSLWAAAPAPTAVSTTPFGGWTGEDRVMITWANGAITDTYLQVRIKANSNTELRDLSSFYGSGIGEMFFFGNLVGETASVTPAGDFARTVPADGGAILANGTQINVGITNQLDINKSNSTTVAGDRGPIVTLGTGTLPRVSIPVSHAAVDLQVDGSIIFWNRDDDNGNGQQDVLDLGPLAAADDDLERMNLAFGQMGLSQAELNDLRLTLTVTPAGTPVRIWNSATKNNQVNSGTTWTTAQLPSALFIEGVAPGSATLTLRVWRQSTSATLNTDNIVVTVNYLDLIGHTPETAPFQRQAIPFANEDDPGVYIRRNGDDDNHNGTPDRNDTNVVGENDLIFVSIATGFMAPAGVRFELEKSSADIRVWNSSTKTTELAAGQSSGEITFPNGVPASIWVEWVTPGTGPAASTLTVRLIDDVSNNVIFTDQLVFHPFTSIVVVMGGEGGIPSDPTAVGTFQTAIDLYREGYDVHMYDEDEVVGDPTAATGDVFDEVRSAIAVRGVTSVAIFGHSHGGGATFNLASQLTANPPASGTFTISFTAYIDAVTQTAAGAENRLPPSDWHLNLYQDSGLISGGPVPGSNEEFDVNNHPLWMLNVSHTTIDDHLQVRDWLKMRLKQNVDR